MHIRQRPHMLQLSQVARQSWQSLDLQKEFCCWEWVLGPELVVCTILLTSWAQAVDSSRRAVICRTAILRLISATNQSGWYVQNSLQMFYCVGSVIKETKSIQLTVLPREINSPKHINFNYQIFLACKFCIKQMIMLQQYSIFFIKLENPRPIGRFSLAPAEGWVTVLWSFGFVDLCIWPWVKILC